MAEEITDSIQNIEETATQVQEDMDLAADFSDQFIATDSTAELSNKPSENGGTKRGREEEDVNEEKRATKKPNAEKSLEEERLDILEGKEEVKETMEVEEEVKKETEDVKETVEVEEEVKKETESAAAKVGPKMFCSSVEMFDYFHKLLHEWPTNLDINKYEHMALIDLLKKGHSDAEKKFGEGIEAFQVRYHPSWKNRCFFLIRIDGSVDDFSFRKCVDHILPLPDNMKVPSTPSNGMKAWGQQKGGRGSHGRGGGSYGRGGGRGGRGRGSRGR